MHADAVRLYRPVGLKELQRIELAGFKGFPPRLPEQPIFYPVTNEAYATRIARDWNTQFGAKQGFVTTFLVTKSHLDRFERKIVGGREHEEYWIPAEELSEFNSHIVGLIEVFASFTETDRAEVQGDKTDAA